MGIMVYSLLWVMQDFVHQPYLPGCYSELADEGFEYVAVFHLPIVSIVVPFSGLTKYIIRIL